MTLQKDFSMKDLINVILNVRDVPENEIRADIGYYEWDNKG